MIKFELVCVIPVSNKFKIRREKDVYRFLKSKVFVKCYKVFSPVLKGMPDFIVMKTNYEQLKPGFYEVKYNKLQLTENQEKVIQELVESFNVYVVLYDSLTNNVNFYRVYLDKGKN